MDIKTNSQAASYYSQLITNSGDSLQETGSSSTGSTSSNSNAAIQARASAVRLSGLLTHYQAIVERSARSISVLSENIITFDQQASQQISQQIS